MTPPPPTATPDRLTLTPARAELLAPLRQYLAARAEEFAFIPTDRLALLERFAAAIRARLDAGQPARVVAVCTHNSRRSFMAQLWLAAAGVHRGVDVRAYSAGTESTAFNPRAVASLRRAGFDIEQATDDANPTYLARLAPALPPVVCFSKAVGADPLPREGMLALLVCTEADGACPTVPGAAARFPIPFEDPKAFDATPREAAAYDERCAQIAREMLYAVTRARP
jgi:arsenate reductase